MVSCRLHGESGFVHRSTMDHSRLLSTNGSIVDGIGLWGLC